MQAITFLKEAERLQNPVFFLSDVVRIIEKKRDYARVYIHRMKQRNLVYEIEKGKYSLMDDALAVATGLVFPSYISFLSAYSIYGFTTQLPIIVQVVSTKSKNPVTVGNSSIEFIRFKIQNMFGYKREQFRETYIFLAEPEKAVVDSLYLPDHCPLSETYEALQSKDINHDKLIAYALRIDSIVTLKRLGYLLEINGVDIYEKIQHRLNKRYDLLNPFLKKSKITSSKWKLNLNEEFA